MVFLIRFNSINKKWFEMNKYVKKEKLFFEKEYNV